MKNGMEISEAADKALQAMPEGYELKEQLLAHKAEVIGMWNNEYNEQETMQMFKEEGRQECEDLFAALIKKLSALGKNDEILKLADDSALREKLFIQYGLKKPV